MAKEEADREAAKRAEEAKQLEPKPANFPEWLQSPAWRFYEAAYLLEGFEPAQLKDFNPSDRDTQPKESPRHRVALMYDRMKGAADVGELKDFVKGQGGELRLRKAKPRVYVQWAHGRKYTLPEDLKPLLSPPKELHAREENTYQYLIGALVRIIMGESAGCEPHPDFKDRQALKEHLAAKFGAGGLSVSNLNRKLPEAERALAAALGESP